MRSDSSDPAGDRLIKFMFDDAPVRGEAVAIRTAWRHIVSLHDFPAPVERMLGEMLAAAALLSSTLKFDGALVMQLHGDGPVKLLVAECNSDLGMRATAKVDPNADIDDDAPLQSLVNVHGRARMAITLDPRDRKPGQQPYQGVVPVEGDSVAEILEGYMARSEQLDTRLWLACSDEAATGLLLQRLPSEGGTTEVEKRQEAVYEQAWERIRHLASTIRSEELLGLPPEEVARRLFWEEHALLLGTRNARFQCTCSREKVGNMMLSLGREEIDSVIEELGQVRSTCEYCGTVYVFDAVDVAQLFSSDPADRTMPPGQMRH
ncbi:MAG TPA: Hsp33 family molecular chaperone HslO [Burkholderiaceae bacterium]|nr:Hsp33 family molecular chaperone HslO [Burkholderiaceae bacterium]